MQVRTERAERGKSCKRTDRVKRAQMAEKTNEDM